MNYTRENNPLYSRESELCLRIGKAAAIKKRVALWDIEWVLWHHIAFNGFFDDLEYTLISTKPEKVGGAYGGKENWQSPVIQSPDALHQFKPDWVILCAADAGVREYMEVRKKFSLGLDQIFLPNEGWNKTPLFPANDQAEHFVRKVPEQIIGSTSAETPVQIYEAVKYVAQNDIPGDFVQFGVLNGWSMYYTGLIRDHFGLQNRKIIGFDTFTGFVAPERGRDVYLSMNSRPAKTFTFVDKSAVETNLSALGNIELVEGDIRKTAARLNGGQYSFVFDDFDDYSPTVSGLACMDACMSTGGVIVHDHYAWTTLGDYGECVGERVAMDEFVENSAYYWLNQPGTNSFYKCKAKST